MTIDEFRNELVAKISDEMPADMQIITNDVMKNNDEIFKGITFKMPDENISPTVYVNQAYADYNKGVSFNDISESLVNCIKNELSKRKGKHNIDAEQFNNFDNVKDYIQYKLVNLEKNTDYLADKAYTVVDDLAVLYTVNTKELFGIEGVIAIKPDMLKNWGVDIDTISEYAKRNDEKVLVDFRPIAEILKESMIAAEAPFEFIEETYNQARQVPFYVLTNTQKLNGASLMFNEKAMEQVREKFGEDFIIIPSSIHECIICKNDGFIDIELVKEMVAEINGSEIPANEVLSDNVYGYDFKEKTFYVYDGERERDFDEERDDI